MSARRLRAALALALVMILGGSFVGDQHCLAPKRRARSRRHCAWVPAVGQVRCLQTTLNAQGYNSGPVDGSFGAMTYRAVVRYQAAKRLFVDGVVGRQTGTSLGVWGAAPLVRWCHVWWWHVGRRRAWRSHGGMLDRLGVTSRLVGRPGPLPAVAPDRRRVPSRPDRRGVRHDDAQRCRALPTSQGSARRRHRRPSHRHVVGHLGDDGEWRGAPAAADEPMHATVGRAGCRPSGGRRQLVGKRGRRRLARVHRRSMDVPADGHAGPRRA